jgi:hypothetical protein
MLDGSYPKTKWQGYMGTPYFESKSLASRTYSPAKSPFFGKGGAEYGKGALGDLELEYYLDDFTDPWVPSDTILTHNLGQISPPAKRVGGLRQAGPGPHP